MAWLLDSRNDPRVLLLTTIVQTARARVVGCGVQGGEPRVPTAAIVIDATPRLP